MTNEALKELLNDLSLEEKVGQLIQVSADTLVEGGIVTGPTGSLELNAEQVALVGSVLGKAGAKALREIQDKQMAAQPHHIPMLFMYDVINGFQTIFPIALGLGATFSPEMVETVAEVSAKEATASGLHVTFSPMVDTVRDARWGRVMESTGEDPYLNGLLAKAWIKGYQGNDNDVRKEGKIAACFKHFAAYGAPEGGRDYDNVELSERTLREDYLPGYQACIEAGCKMGMTSFNTINRIPSSGNKWLMRDVLRDEMKFDGIMISDYSAVEEMIKHSFAKDPRDAAKLAMDAGVDIDMVSRAYVQHLAKLVRDGEVDEKLVDEAVWRVLVLKNELGLFENPYKDGDEEKEKLITLCEEFRTKAKEVAAGSFVLVQNKEEILPLAKKEKIAVIGPYAMSHDLHGSWSFPNNPELQISVEQGVKELLGSDADVTFCQGSYCMDPEEQTKYGVKEERTGARCEENEAFYAKEEAWLEEAVSAAAKADKVVMCLGEHNLHTGEGASKVDIRLSDCQMTLLRKVQEVNKNIVTLIFTGRPLELREVEKYSKAVMVVWLPGTEGGSAIAEVLYGAMRPQGRLPMSFPVSVGQEPIYYNHFMTGRPNDTGRRVGYISGYIDETCKPLHPFGYGLTYGKVTYSKVTLSSEKMTSTASLTASVTVTNEGVHPATETVQLYLRDVTGSVIRPVRALKGVKKVDLMPGESKEVAFEITEPMLRFYDINMNYVSEAGEEIAYIGSDAETENGASFTFEG